MEYIASQFELFGLQPAGDHGTYYQRVPLVGARTVPEKSSISFVKDGAPAITPKYGDDFVTGDQTQKESNELDSELIFVGHGVEAPEYKWDDYKGLDTRGKTLVMLVDDPPASPAEPDLFKGKTRTYYGRWTYKYEIGTAKGAQGVILIHTNDAAGYGWGVVRNSWGGEKSYLEVKPGAPALRFAAWVSEQFAAQLFKGAGLDLNTMTKAAASRDFKPVSLGYHLSGQRRAQVRQRQRHREAFRLRSCAQGRSRPLLRPPRSLRHREGRSERRPERHDLQRRHRQRLGLCAADRLGARLGDLWCETEALDLLRRRRRRGAGTPRIAMAGRESSPPHRQDRPRHQLRRHSRARPRP
jgi:hypothetical protein